MESRKTTWRYLAHQKPFQSCWWQETTSPIGVKLFQYLLTQAAKRGQSVRRKVDYLTGPRVSSHSCYFGFRHRFNFWVWYRVWCYRYDIDHSIFVRLCPVPHPTCCCRFSSHFPPQKLFTMASNLAISSSMQVSVTSLEGASARDQKRWNTGEYWNTKHLRTYRITNKN